MTRVTGTDLCGETVRSLLSSPCNSPVALVNPINGPVSLGDKRDASIRAW